ncbi:MAG: metalloregulator ArsR/SmtB family transcription factor [Deltaproteobacteria bacterium]|nr:metalloregulator ArsR/SmtB family transcription factor [Deltaproteobacteria bacterium]
MGHEAKQRIYEQFARIGRALSAPGRLDLLDLLTQGERPVDALAELSEQSVANASAHLHVLAAAHLVAQRRDGKRVYYRLADPSVLTLWLSLRDTAEHQLAELEGVAREYLEGADELEPTSREELLARMKDGTAMLIDVRPKEEFEQGHLPGALSVPLAGVDRWARETKVPKNKRVIAYCRGPYCVYAVKAVQKLAKRGIDASRLEDGVSEWRAAGLRIETARPKGAAR